MVSSPVPKGFLMRSVAVDGSEFKYVVYVPPAYDPAEPMPTILFLNGKGECGSDGLKQIAVGLGPAVMFHVEQWPFLIIFPQKQHAEDKWEDEEAMVMAVLDAVRAEFNVDQSRLYLTGISQGGHGTWAIAASHPDLFAAIAPVCGWGNKTIAKKVAKLPIWIFHGEADFVVRIQTSLEMEESIKAAGGCPKLTTYPKVGHNSWDKAYNDENLGEWFLEHRKA